MPAHKIIFAFLLSFLLNSATASSPDIQLDLLTFRITEAIKSGNYQGALSDFSEVEKLSLTLNKPLPESFYYYYVEALDKTGKDSETLQRCEIYFDKFGNSGKYYDRIIPIMSRVQAVAKKANEERTRADELKAARLVKYRNDLAKYEKDNKDYQERMSSIMSRLPECKAQQTKDMNACEAVAKKKASAFWVDHAAVERQYAFCWDRYGYNCQKILENEVQEVSPPILPKPPEDGR